MAFRCVRDPAFRLSGPRLYNFQPRREILLDEVEGWFTVSPGSPSSLVKIRYFVERTYSETLSKPGMLCTEVRTELPGFTTLFSSLPVAPHPRDTSLPGVSRPGYLRDAQDKRQNIPVDIQPRQ